MANSRDQAPDLFASPDREDKVQAPLAERMRPRAFADFVGQDDITAVERPLRRAIEADQLSSIIFWGPPGSGKTTLAHLIAQHTKGQFVSFSAVTSGVPELRTIIKAAEQRRSMNGERTILFVDEIHRFNKAQQDGFLPHMEDGTILLVGATTENPSFELNAALLSRAQVIVLERLSPADLERLAQRAEQDLGRQLPLTPAARDQLIGMADGDGRALLNLIEQVAAHKGDRLDPAALGQRLMRRAAKYDKTGEEHYNLISALHKSVRGSDPDAALYWFARMLEGGEDPRFLARRLTRMAVEDIGLADPQAQAVCLDSWQTYERLGSPEGELALAQAVIYVALAPKSNGAYVAYKAARASARQTGSLMPPKTILNAPTGMMKDMGYGADYAYDHNAEDGFSGQNYFPEGMKRPVFYAPPERGFERELQKRIDFFAKLRAKRQSG
jgi:putative ATPase